MTVSSALLPPLIKLVAVLFICPSLFGLISIHTNAGVSKCVVGPSATDKEHTVSNYATIDGINPKDFFGVWSQPPVGYQSLSRFIKCNIHNPSRKRSNQSQWKIVDGLDLECDNDFAMDFDENKLMWCISKKDVDGTTTNRFCRPGSKSESSDSIGMIRIIRHPDGIYTHVMNNRVSSLNVQCDAENLHWLHGKFYPATSLLLLLNIGLAFLYWDKHVDPFTVCKQYSKIVFDMQIWRSFTGALAHFEGLHLLFNMTTLYTFGNTLESTFGSVPFLFYNICMIPLTTIIMIGLIYLQIRLKRNDQYAQTSSVGFSGVLFAWSVVSSLESYAICPIPFAPDMCFATTTYNIGFITLKFNLGPFIQLLLMQFIMPRASFIGHLSGIICGFIFHWKLLPQELFWNPQTLIPILVLLHWIFARKIIPLPSCQSVEAGMDKTSIDCDEHSQSYKEAEAAKNGRILVWAKRMMVLCLILSLVVFDPYSSMSISQIISCVYTLLSVQCQLNTYDSKGTGTYVSCDLWRGTIITTILLLSTDAFTVPIWLLFQLKIYSNMYSTYDNWFELIVMTFRWLAHFFILLVASKMLSESGILESEPKIFEKIFGRIVTWCTHIYNLVFNVSSMTNSFVPFRGMGRTLGSEGDDSIVNRRIPVESEKA